MGRPASVIALVLLLAALPGCRRTASPPATSGPAPDLSPVRVTSTKTGAVKSVAIDSLSSRHVQDVAELLQGRVPGLQVIRDGTGEISLRIRNSDSIMSTGEPLLILDGAPVSEQNLSLVLRQLNPREVETIDVLRDVASTSVYGEKGAHGVIIITMKRH
jgi:TonB-dependent starch-binding outer membrane protein SusC